MKARSENWKEQTNVFNAFSCTLCIYYFMTFPSLWSINSISLYYFSMTVQKIIRLVSSLHPM